MGNATIFDCSFELISRGKSPALVLILSFPIVVRAERVVKLGWKLHGEVLIVASRNPFEKCFI